MLCAEMAPPIRVMQTITPVGVKETKPGVFVFDMGQNFAGWAQLKVSGPAGKAVAMRYGERINAAGDLERKDNRRLRSARVPSRPIPTSSVAAAKRSRSRASPTTASGGSR